MPDGPIGCIAPATRERSAMPRLPPKQCAAPACPALITAGRFCEAHADREPRRTWSPDRPPPEKRGYGTAWRKLRKIILHRDPICRVCGIAPATEVDHVTPLAAGGDNSDENLRGICEDCHGRKSAREAAQGRRAGRVRPQEPRR